MPEPSEQAVRQALGRIRASAPFSQAHRLQHFLSFVVEQALAGQSHAIKESTIGVEVCGRAPGFDPRSDPIVRVDASRLRSRLEAYYKAEGRNDSVEIRLPKGTYVPEIAERHGGSASPPPHVVAILPFVNLGPSARDDYLSDGLTEELIHQLSRLERLRVIARTSAFQFKGRAADVREIGRTLSCSHVVEGSVLVLRERLRITAQLTESAGGWVIWSSKYERPAADLFTIQDEICAAIVTALRLRLDPPLRAHPPSPDAHRAYLEGRHYWNQRSAEALRKSIACYERAIDLDAVYALPYCGIADSLLVQSLNDDLPTPEALPRAKESAGKAMELAPHLAEPYVSRANIRSVYDWDWAGAAGDYVTAAELNPAAAHYLYAILNLAPRAQWFDARREMDAALQADPAAAVLYRDAGLMEYLARDYEAAERALDKSEQLAPSFYGAHFWRARIRAEQGRYAEAIHALEARQTAAPANRRVLAVLALTYTRMGREREAVTIAAGITSDCAASPLDRAIAHMACGNNDAALDDLERAATGRFTTLYQARVDPIYDPLRSNHRFQEILRSMNLTS